MHFSFGNNKNKHYHRREDFMKNFCKGLKQHTAEIINHENEKKSYCKQVFRHICEKEFSSYDDDKRYLKFRDHCHYTRKYRAAARNICNLRYKTSKDILVLFHSGSNYDYHFIIKELAEEFEGKFECLGENNEKYITFSVPI